MTTLYLLFEWTEERESKNHIGIFSTLDKAKQAAQLTFDAEGGDAEGVEGFQLEWKMLDSDSGSTQWYAPQGSARHNAEYPYEIDEFTLDKLHLTEFDEAVRKW